MKNKADIIIISDIHLGSPTSKVDLLSQVLKQWIFKKLIILGDLFAHNDFTRLRPSEWQLLKSLSKLVNLGIDVVWVEGNHDIGPIQNLSYLLGIIIQQEYSWVWNNKQCTAIHGHQFDKLTNTKFSKFMSWLYLSVLEYAFVRKFFSSYFESIGSNWQRIDKDVEIGCIVHAKKNNIDIVIAGHTHKSELILDGNIIYVNTGCWVDKKGTLVALEKNNIHMISYSNSINGEDSVFKT